MIYTDAKLKIESVETREIENETCLVTTARVIEPDGEFAADDVISWVTRPLALSEHSEESK